MKTNEELIAEITKDAESVINKPITTPITMDSDFRAELGFDSIQLLYLIMALEKRYDISFEDADIDSFQTVGAVVQYIASKIN